MPKKDIHPEYFKDMKVTCACGNTLITGGTRQKAMLEICNACHPVWTGKEKVLDVKGRVEKFKTRRAKSAELPKPRTKRAKLAAKSARKKT